MLEQQNIYYAALPMDVQNKWKPHLSLKELRKGERLTLDKVSGVIYFPITCIAIVSAFLTLGQNTFFRFSGRDVVIGVANLTNNSAIEFEAKICRGGYALTLPVEVLKKHLPIPSVSINIATVVTATIAEKLSQSAYCAQTHTNSQRLARVLLEAGSNFSIEDGIVLTQREIADIVGVRREAVAEQLGVWSRMGIISTERSRIRISNREQMIAISCGCYQVIERSQKADLDHWREIAWRIY